MVESDIHFDIAIEKDNAEISISPNDVKAMFQTSSEACKLDYHLSQTSTGPLDFSRAPWEGYVSFDMTGSGLEVNHYGKLTSDKDHSISFYIRAKSLG